MNNTNKGECNIRIEEIQTKIEDWLDFDSHNDILPLKINFSDIEIIAESLAPEIAKLLSQTQSQTIERCLDCRPRLRTSPNPLKLDIVHNSGERKAMFKNKMYNQALTDWTDNIKNLSGEIKREGEEWQ